MGTDAGIEFIATVDEALNAASKIEDLNLRVNNSGLGVSCAPNIYQTKEGTFRLYGQTHWSHDSKNGRVLVKEIMAWIKRNHLQIKIKSKWYV